MPITKLSSGRSSAVMLRYLSKDNEEGTRVRAMGGNVSGNDWRSAEREFTLTRDQYGASDGIRYHHASLSFEPKDLGSLAQTDGMPNYPKLVALGERWAEMNGISDHHQVLVVAHGDKPHPHIHICWNSVDGQDGSKWHSDRAFLERARDTTDALAREYGIRNEPRREKNGTRPPDKVLRAAARGADSYSWKVDLRARIAEAARSSVGEEDFKKKLVQRGVEVRQRGDAYSYGFRDATDKHRVARAGRLGEEYQRGPLLERLDAQRKNLLRGPQAVEAFAKRMREEQGSPLQSWRQELRRHLSEVRQIATGMEAYRDQLAKRGIKIERDTAGYHYTFTANDGLPHRMAGRALGASYSEERLTARFVENNRAPIASGSLILSRSAASLGGLAERLTTEIRRESHAGHADVYEDRSRPRRNQEWNDRKGHERF